MPGIHAVARRWRARFPASLGGKLVLILTGVGLLGAAAITLFLAAIITPSFNRLEQTAIDGHVQRTHAALGEFASKVESAVRDYGDWNDSYDYMGAPNRAFEEDSFATTAMVNLGVNGMAYVGNDRRVVIARWLDLASSRDEPAMRARMLGAVGALDLNRLLAGKTSKSFYVRLGDGLAAVAVARVRRTDGSGAPRGYVVLARLIGSEQLSTLLQLKARLDLANPGAAVAIVGHGSRLDVAVPVRGPDGRAVANATYSVPRDLSKLGKRMLLLAVGGSTLLLLFVLVVLRRMIGRLVLRPLKRVESHMGLVRESGTLGLLTDIERKDEIGSLVTSFNAMLRQLKDLREQLEMQSFKLGRNESAVAVMHNVRNALNPISTILSQGLAQSPSVDRAMFDRALSELAREDIPPVRRQKLVAFVAAAAQSEADERADRRGQLEIGRTALHNVLEIIGKQQEDAHERPQLETCDLTDIVAQNATIARYSGGSSIMFTFPSKPHLVLGSRVILSQVIGNLFANAAEAISATGRDSGSIAVTICETGETAELVIRDDGDGFDPGRAPTLFQRGFSTRKHKSGGLGLHWCANAMLGMGGALQLSSDGSGLGARAILTLPSAPAAVMAKARDLAA
jgi:signal transduction histidine kinase